MWDRIKRKPTFIPLIYIVIKLNFANKIPGHFSSRNSNFGSVNFRSPQQKQGASVTIEKIGID